jgi:hypothetical protein
MVTREIFADEIAIDFPSVDQLIDRVREGFLGEPFAPEMLTAEVSVSARDAITGTIVPLEIPLRGTCAECGGRGETWAEPCVACRGSGNWFLRRSLRFLVPPGVSDGARFRFRVGSARAASVSVEVRVAIRNF